MKIIETGPREIGFVLWGHCQNLLDDPHKICAWGLFLPLQNSADPNGIQCFVDALLNS